MTKWKVIDKVDKYVYNENIEAETADEAGLAWMREHMFDVVPQDDEY